MSESDRLRKCVPCSPVPLISVITVVYNGVRELDATLRSVFSQESDLYELVVIDGGSTDGTLDVLQRYSDQIAACVSERDDGIYSAMNKGIERARGEWLYFLNCGDRFVSGDVLLKISRYLACTQKSLVVGKVNYIGDGRVLKQLPEGVPARATPRALFESKLCHQAVFARRQAYMAAGGFDTRYRVFSDFNTVYRIICEGGFDRIDMAIADFDSSGISSDFRYAVRLYCEAEHILSSLGQPRGRAAFGLGWLRALAYQWRKQIATKLK